MLRKKHVICFIISEYTMCGKYTDTAEEIVKLQADGKH